MPRLLRPARLAVPILMAFGAFAQSQDRTPAALVPEPHETPRIHPPMFFREDWRVTPGIPLMHLVTPGDAGNPDLELKVYGPSGKEIYMNGAPDQPNNPPHLWTGLCLQTCAAALRDKHNYVDLSGWGKIRWLTRQSGLNQIHAIIKLADGTWLVSEHGDAVGLDHHISEFTLSETRWIGLDINRVVTRGLWLDKVDLSRVDEIGFTTLMPGSGQGYGGYGDVGWIEVYGRAVPRSGDSASAHATGEPVLDAQSQKLLAPFAGRSVTELLKDPQARGLGRTLYVKTCMVCHGTDGRGNTSSGTPNLTDNDWLWGGAPENVVATITDGRAANMPAWGEVLGQSGVEDVLAYTLTLSGRSLPNADPVRGKELYGTTCASCHGYQGRGDPQIGATNLTDQIWLYGGSVEAVRESISRGRKGAMPAPGEPLGATRIKLLAAYVLGLNESASGH